MPKPEEWYNNPNAKEIISYSYDNKGNEIRFRRRFLTERIGKTKKKDIVKFSVGLEININGEWKHIVRHCNSHANSKSEFHTHNDYRLPFLGNEIRIIRILKERKIPASQMRWASHDITNRYILYIKQFLKTIKS